MEYKVLWDVVPESSGNVKINNNECKYLLARLNWNDYGYRTKYRLFLVLQQDENIYQNLYLGALSCVEINPEYRPGRTFIPKPNGNYVTFILDTTTAERMFLFLSYEERMELISKLKIKFSSREVEYQDNYRTSTLRCFETETTFLEMQKEIKNIVTSPLDASAMLHRHIDEIRIDNKPESYCEKDEETLTTYQANITFSK